MHVQDETIKRRNIGKSVSYTHLDVYKRQELIGGCDIILEMYQAGELQTLLSEVAAKHQA